MIWGWGCIFTAFFPHSKLPHTWKSHDADKENSKASYQLMRQLKFVSCELKSKEKTKNVH